MKKRIALSVSLHIEQEAHKLIRVRTHNPKYKEKQSG